MGRICRCFYKKLLMGLDLVQDAEKQWNESGRISTKTILELLQQNGNYAGYT